jgi:monoamine oxidase
MAGQIETKASLVAMEPASGKKLRLTIQRDSGTKQEEYHHVVLALPFTMLRAVDTKKLELPDDKRHVIKELGYGAHTKLIGAYRGRPWRTMSRATGGAYSDNGVQTLWESGASASGGTGVLTAFIGATPALMAATGTPEEQVVKHTALIEQIFPRSQAAYVGSSGLRMAWQEYPYTLASYSGYKTGQWSFQGLERRRAGNLHFCGEHCSIEFQGFMEGAVATGEQAAQEILRDLSIKTTAVRPAARETGTYPAAPSSM